MKVTTLGTRGKVEPSSPDHKNHTGILINNELLIDVGEANFMKHKPKWIIFTHFHPDHGFFISRGEPFSPEVPHFGPEPHQLIPKLQIVNEPFEIGSYRIRPFPVIHALRLKSLGYIIEKENKKVLFTGDVAWIEKKVLQELPLVDLVITEATLIKKGGRINRKKDKIFGHTGVPDLIRILKPLSKRLAFIHYGEWFFEDVEKNIQQLIELGIEGLEIIPAHDSMEINLKKEP